MGTKNIYNVCTRVSMCMHLRERFFNCLMSHQAAPRTAGEKARDITQLLNCYLQVSPTAGAVLMEEETPSRSTAICTRTHTYLSGWGSPDPLLCLPDLMGRNRGQKGSRRVSHIWGHDNRTGPVGGPHATPLHP